MPAEYILYSTSACHLCEQAEEIIQLVSQDLSINWIKTDIVDDALLLAQYGLSIPVLKCLANSEELRWPFNEDALRTFIHRQ